MTHEDKQLLLKDISARFPYGVKVQVYYEDVTGSGYFDETVWLIDNDDEHFHVNDMWVENIKPYLRPMSSMTEEERKEATQFEINNLGPIGFNWNLLVSDSSKLVDWLLAHHFDFRGLIEKGLALEAPEDMYK